MSEVVPLVQPLNPVIRERSLPKGGMDFNVPSSMGKLTSLLLALTIAGCGCPSHCDACDEHGNCVRKIQTSGPGWGKDPPRMNAVALAWLLTG